MSIKEKIENNIIFWTLSVIVVGFVSGIAAYKSLLEISNLTTIERGRLELLKECTVPAEKLGLTKDYDEVLGKIYSYKDVVGPPPNVGLMTGGILALRDFPQKKQQSLIVLEELRNDKYLKNPAFDTQYVSLIKVIEQVESEIADQ